MTSALDDLAQCFPLDVRIGQLQTQAYIQVSREWSPEKRKEQVQDSLPKQSSGWYGSQSNLPVDMAAKACKADVSMTHCMISS